jgi:hypothetical protein
MGHAFDLQARLARRNTHITDRDVFVMCLGASIVVQPIVWPDRSFASLMNQGVDWRNRARKLIAAAVLGIFSDPNFY